MWTTASGTLCDMTPRFFAFLFVLGLFVAVGAFAVGKFLGMAGCPAP